MRVFLICLLFSSKSLFAGTLVLPKDSIHPDSVKRNRLLPGPVFNYSPETNFVFGLSALYSFYSEKKDRITRPSILFVTGIYTLRKQVIADLYFNFWSRRNNMHHVLELSYYRYNYFYYGMGNHTRQIDEVDLQQKKTELTYSIEKRILKHFYIGLDFNYKNDFYLKPGPERINNISPVVGANGGDFLRGGGSLIYDSRNSPNYASSGNFFKIAFSHTLDIVRNDFRFYRVLAETRTFIPLSFSKKHVLGLNTNIETVQGQVPFFEMRQLGGPFIMRGYYSGRFRDQNLLAVQMEYRWRFLNRWAFVVFSGAGNVFANGEREIWNLKPSIGAGLRYFYDIAAGINIRLDYGVGEFIPGEGRVHNFYLFVGEAF